MATKCPYCGGDVEKSDDGSTADCPACRRKFRIRQRPRAQRQDVQAAPQETSVSDVTKPCPYCGEAIKAVAIKCRFCGEMLNDAPRQSGAAVARLQQNPLPPTPPQQNPIYDSEVQESTIYEGPPSQWTNLATFIVCSFLFLKGIILMVGGGFIPVSNVPTGLIGFGIFSLAVLIAVISYLNVRFTTYSITTERIEVEKGWLSKQVDHIDLFRLQDVQFRQSLLNRLVGIGTVTVISRDASDPVLKLNGMFSPRRTYDRLKKEAVRADRRRGVVHLE